MTLHVDTDNDTNINFSDMELIHDVDGDGVASAGEPVVSNRDPYRKFCKVPYP